MVVMDTQDYINKCNNLLAQLTYRPIPRDPTNKIQAKLITMLRKVKNHTGLDNNTYKAMYPTGCSVLKFYRLPKIYKLDIPPRPIVSIRGLVTYGVAKILMKILEPLVGRSPTTSIVLRTLLNRLIR